EGVMTSYGTNQGLVNTNVEHITEDRDGALWIGTSGGLSRFKDGAFTNYTTKDGLSHNHIRDIVQTADGAIWIGTYGGGLSRFKDGKFVRITVANGLSDDIVSRIIEDGDGNFWMSSNRGIYRVSLKELNDFADRKVNSVTSTSYGISDGMYSSECNGGFQ